MSYVFFLSSWLLILLIFEDWGFIKMTSIWHHLIIDIIACKDQTEDVQIIDKQYYFNMHKKNGHINKVPADHIAHQNNFFVIYTCKNIVSKG